MEYIVRIQSEAYDDVEGVESETKAKEIVCKFHEDICTVYSREEILDMAREEIPDLEIGYSPCGASDEEFAISSQWHDTSEFLKEALEALGYELLFSDEYVVGSKGNIYYTQPMYWGDIPPVVYPPNSGELYTPDDDPLTVIEACTIEKSCHYDYKAILPPWIESKDIVKAGYSKLRTFKDVAGAAEHEELKKLLDSGIPLVFRYPGPFTTKLEVWELNNE